MKNIFIYGTTFALFMIFINQLFITYYAQSRIRDENIEKIKWCNSDDEIEKVFNHECRKAREALDLYPFFSSFISTIWFFGDKFFDPIRSITNSWIFLIITSILTYTVFNAFVFRGWDWFFYFLEKKRTSALLGPIKPSPSPNSRGKVEELEMEIFQEE